MSWLVCISIPALAGALYPLIYVGYRRMLNYKRDEIVGLMSKGKTFQAYLQAFRGAGAGVVPENEHDKNQELAKTVEQLFNVYYDWRAYLIPISICTILSFIACLVALAEAGVSTPTLGTGLIALARKLPPVGLSAMAGAYVWGLYEMVRNIRGLNLSPTRIHVIWLRLLIAPILGYLLSLPLNDPVKLAAGFAVGAFPLKQLLEFVQARGTKLLNIESAKAPAEGPTLQHIQGLTEDMIDTMNEEGVCSSEHLAQADPIKLLLRTKLEWKIILDLVDQAYLFNYVGEKLVELRPLGIRGAIELAALKGELDDPDDKIRTRAESFLEVLAPKLGQDVKAVRNLVMALDEDVQVRFIWDLWGEV